MNICWKLKDVPELAALSSDERSRVHEACLQQHFIKAPVTRKIVTAYVAFMVCIPATTLLLTTIVLQLGFPLPIWMVGVAATVGFVFGRYLFSRLAIPTLRPFYREFIKKESGRSK